MAGGDEKKSKAGGGDAKKPNAGGGGAKKPNASGGECLWLHSHCGCASFANAMRVRMF